LRVPWTLLPVSVVQTVSHVDRLYGEELAQRIALKRGRDAWQFERIDVITVPSRSVYARESKVRRLYSVSVFHFVQELGGTYKDTIRTAIETCAKETIEKSYKQEDTCLAFPALAGARYVREQELVLSYAQSFSSILAGISRVRGGVPSRVCLVVWDDLVGTPEMAAALHGLEEALYVHVPRWRTTLGNLIVVLVACSFALGVAHAAAQDGELTGGKLRLLVMTIVLVALGLVSSLAQGVMRTVPAQKAPLLIPAGLAALTYMMAALLYHMRIVSFLAAGSKKR